MTQLAQDGASRSDKGTIKLLSRDALVLAQIGEQGAVRLDQLRCLFGALSQRLTQEPGMVSLTTARRIVERLKAKGLVRYKLIFSREQPWVWLTSKGLRELGLPYREVAPTAALTNHYYWVNQVYLWVRQHYPNDQWVSERRLRKDREGTASESKHLPDAELHRYDVHGELTIISIEVELTIKEKQRALRIMQELGDSYDGIWYFTNAVTATSVKRTLTQLDEEVRTRFRIRDLTNFT